MFWWGLEALLVDLPALFKIYYFYVSTAISIYALGGEKGREGGGWPAVLVATPVGTPAQPP